MNIYKKCLAYQDLLADLILLDVDRDAAVEIIDNLHFHVYAGLGTTSMQKLAVKLSIDEDEDEDEDEDDETAQHEQYYLDSIRQGVMNQ